MRSRFIFAALAGTLILSGCGPQSGDSNDEQPDGGNSPDAGTPGIITEVEGTSELDEDPFVIAARAEDTGYLMAVNALDFSIPEFTQTHSPEDQQEIYDFFIDEYVTGGAPVIMFPGPSIWLPLEVSVNEAGDGAEVRFCDASVDWAVSAEFPEPAYDLANGEELVITIVTGDSGDLVFGGEERRGGSCDATGAPVQRFDPQPAIPDGPIVIEDVTPPPA